MANWENMTVQDLYDLGLTLEDFEAMLDQGVDPFATDYDSMGVMSPIDISPQATQWDILDAQKTARKVNRPATPNERRQDRGYYTPDPEAFPYDVVTQSNPYLRALLNTAISGAKPGPNQAFDVEQYVFGKVTDPETEGYSKDDKGKTRIGKAVSEVLKKPGEFDYIAEQFHADDRRWATKDRATQRKLLQEWLTSEAGATLEGGAPSISRNVNFSDWALSRQSGEPFGFAGEGFDRAGSFEGGRGGPRVQLDPQYWGKNQTEGMQAQMSLGDFKKAYASTLAKQLGEDIEPGMRIEDPESGGYWVIQRNTREQTPLERQRMANQRFNARQARNKGKGKGRPSIMDRVGGAGAWWNKNVVNPVRDRVPLI